MAYITLAAAYFAYWFAKEHVAAALKEFMEMGIAAYFRQIKEDVIAEEAAKSHAEGFSEGRNAGKAEGIVEGISRGRQSALDELRALPTHEALALLERRDAEPDASPYPESPPNGNDQPPPA